MSDKRFELDMHQAFDAALRQAALGEFARAIQHLDLDPVSREQHEAPLLASARAVHEARKSIKRLRALLRLVAAAPAEKKKHAARQAIYTSCDSYLSTASDLLSSQRDADATCDTLRKLQRLAAHQEEQSAVARSESYIDALQRESSGQPALRDIVEQVRRSLSAAQEIFETAPTHHKSDLKQGLEDAQRRARRRYRKALRRHAALRQLSGVETSAERLSSGTRRYDEALHELRKSLKDARYHLRLLRPALSKELEAERQVAQQASDLLGEDHDLKLTQERLAQAPLSAAERYALHALIFYRRTKLQSQALRLAGLLLTEKPKQRRRRLMGYLHHAIAE